MKTKTEIKERIKELKQALDDVKPYGDEYFEIRRCINELEWVLDDNNAAQEESVRCLLDKDLCMHCFGDEYCEHQYIEPNSGRVEGALEAQ